MEIRGRWTSRLEKFAVSIQGGVESFASVVSFAAVVQYLFRSSGRDKKGTIPCVSVVTSIKNGLFGWILVVRGKRMSLLLLSLLSRRGVYPGGLGMHIGSIDSFRVAKIGAGRKLISWTIWTFGSITFTCQEVKAFRMSTFGGKSLTTPNQIRVHIPASSR